MWLKHRLEKGLEIYNQMKKTETGAAVCAGQESTRVYMAFSGGGKSANGLKTEADVMKEWAMDHGVPEHVILLDEKAKDTIQNAVLIAPILIRLALTEVTVVTSSFHIPRTSHYFTSIFQQYTHRRSKGYIFTVAYAHAEDGFTEDQRAERVKKELLLKNRSQPLLDRYIRMLMHERAMRKSQLRMTQDVDSDDMSSEDDEFCKQVMSSSSGLRNSDFQLLRVAVNKAALDQKEKETGQQQDAGAEAATSSNETGAAVTTSDSAKD
jgi:hypothetical protein